MRRTVSFQVGEASGVVDLTVQMIDYLEREGVFERDQVRSEERSKGRHRGVRRRYSFRDMVILKAIAGLLGKGVSVRRIKLAIERFSREARFECDRTRVTFDQSSVQYFVTDGTEIFFRKDSSELVSVLASGQQAFLFVMDVAAVGSSVATSVDKHLAARGITF